MGRKSTERLVEETTALLGRYMAEGRNRTDLLKEAAENIVALRARFTLDDGRPDWSGRSAGYREVIRSIYDGAFIPKDYRDTLQSALRYHVGNLVRERVAEDELRAVGLTSPAPKERLARNREVVFALAASAGGQSVLRNPVEAVARSVVILEAIRREDVEALDHDHAVALRLGLERLTGCAGMVGDYLPLSARKSRRRA